MIKHSLLLCIATLVLSVGAVCQPLNRGKLDSLFDILERKDLAWASIAISKNGKVVYKRTTGAARIEGDKRIPATENTTYRIGSITKMFTAVMIYQLVEEKKLSLNDSLSTYFPQMPGAGNITLHQLLSHRSGLADYTKDGHYAEWMDKPQTQNELLTRIVNGKRDFEPGTQADYNNSNYLLLGYIIEKVCRKPYREVLQQRIISKLKLSKTYYANITKLNPDESDSYKYVNSQWQADKRATPDNFGGAGAIISNPNDLTRFIEALFAGKLISKTSLATMTTLTDSYGAGIFPYTFEGYQGLGHGGKTEGFGATLIYYPKEKLTLAYCTNGEVYPKADIQNDALKIYFNKPFTVPTFQPITLNDAELNAYPGTYTSEQFGITIVCTRVGNTLELETRGMKMPLDALESTKFMNTSFGFFFTFNKEKQELVIQDVDDTYYLKKQKSSE